MAVLDTARQFGRPEATCSGRPWFRPLPLPPCRAPRARADHRPCRILAAPGKGHPAQRRGIVTCVALLLLACQRGDAAGPAARAAGLLTLPRSARTTSAWATRTRTAASSSTRRCRSTTSRQAQRRWCRTTAAHLGCSAASPASRSVTPYAWGSITGDVMEEHRSITRSGLGDPQLRFATNLLGGPALTPREFRAHKQGPRWG